MDVEQKKVYGKVICFVMGIFIVLFTLAFVGNIKKKARLVDEYEKAIEVAEITPINPDLIGEVDKTLIENDREYDEVMTKISNLLYYVSQGDLFSAYEMTNYKSFENMEEYFKEYKSHELDYEVLDFKQRDEHLFFVTLETSNLDLGKEDGESEENLDEKNRVMYLVYDKSRDVIYVDGFVYGVKVDDMLHVDQKLVRIDFVSFYMDRVVVDLSVINDGETVVFDDLNISMFLNEKWEKLRRSTIILGNDISKLSIEIPKEYEPNIRVTKFMMTYKENISEIEIK